MAIKISVIVPVYNTAKYLPECLDSIISQTLEDIEIITINDGSPDNALDILKEYAAKDDRIVIIDKKNEGVGKARNDGIAKATGEFIAFMDSDDLYASDDALEKLYRAAKENGVKTAGGEERFLQKDGSKTENTTKEYGMDFKAAGMCRYSDYQYDYGYVRYIFDRKMIVDNNIVFPSYGRFQDPPFFVKAMIVSETFYQIEDCVYLYRMLPAEFKYSVSKTCDFLKGITDNLKVSEKHNLPKLHYLTAKRLDKEASYMAIKNLDNEHITEIFSHMITAASAVNTEWLKDNGYPLQDPFVPEVFIYAADTAVKYHNLRNSKLGRLISKVKGK